MVTVATLLVSVILFVITCIQLQGTIVIFGARERGFYLSIFGGIPLITSIMGVVWWYSIGKRQKKTEKRRLIKDRTLLIINSVFLVMQVVEIGFIITMLIPGSYGPVYILKQDGVQMHWRNDMNN